YLTDAAARETFSFVGAHPPGSGIVFDFVYAAMIDMIKAVDMARVPPAARPFLQRFLDLTRDEPWQFGLPVGGEREFLAGFGLELREAFTIGGEDSLKRYLTKADGTELGAQLIANLRARMMQNASAEGQPGAAGPQVPPERTREQQ